jgi:hypothetical protein
VGAIEHLSKKLAPRYKSKADIEDFGLLMVARQESVYSFDRKITY